MGGGGSKGGGGTTTTTSEASFPAEFRPLATSSVAQIQEAQQALPLANFTGFQPAGVAGLSPMQQWVLSELVPQTTQMPAGQQGLLRVPTTSGLAALGAMSAGNRTPESRSAVDTLSPRLTSSPWPTSSGAPASAPAAAPQSPVDQLVAAMVAAMPTPTAPSAGAFPGSAPTPTSNMVLGIGGPSVDVTQPLAVAPMAPPLPPPLPLSATDALPQAIQDQWRAAYEDQLAHGGTTAPNLSAWIRRQPGFVDTTAPGVADALPQAIQDQWRAAYEDQLAHGGTTAPNLSAWIRRQPGGRGL